MVFEECIDAAYLAGVLDGEGCIRISMGVLHIHINQAQKNQGLLSYLHRKWGGRFRIYPKRKAASLTWSGQYAERVLRAVTPHLTLEKTQAQAALQFQELLPGKPGREIDPAVKIELEHLVGEIKHLKNYPMESTSI